MLDIETLATRSTGTPLDVLVGMIQANPPLTLAMQAGKFGALNARDAITTDDQAVAWLEQHGIAIPANQAAAEAVLLDVLTNGSDVHVVFGVAYCMGVRSLGWGRDAYAEDNAEQEEDTQPTAWN